MSKDLGRSSTPRGAFTLVEMLVVIGIIAILAALLLPAVMAAITRARNAAIAMELKQLDSAIEAYRLEKGDYPPNFRDKTVVLRHLMKCYPRINQTYADTFATYACSRTAVTSGAPIVFIDEGESLVFWLSLTDTNPQYPFLSYFNPSPSTLTPNQKRFYDFDENRLSAPDTSEAGPITGGAQFYSVRSFTAKYCGETHYLHIDSRAYDDLAINYANSSAPVTYAYTEDANYPTSGVGARPYWSTTVNTAFPNATAIIQKLKPANSTTFQIICAGQDGDFGQLSTNPKIFNTGDNYDQGDRDNITNFSGGRTLGDSIP